MSFIIHPLDISLFDVLGHVMRDITRYITRSSGVTSGLVDVCGSRLKHILGIKVYSTYTTGNIEIDVLIMHNV